MRVVWLAVLLGGMAVIAAAALWVLSNQAQSTRALDPDDPQKVETGALIYAEQCAACHGVDLEGQPNWRDPLPDGGLPAPPHSAEGHTWHHEDQLLFDYTKQGGQALLGANFKSHMPGFGDRLSDDEIWAVLSFIKSTWPAQIQDLHDQRNAAVAGE